MRLRGLALAGCCLAIVAAPATLVFGQVRAPTLTAPAAGTHTSDSTPTFAGTANDGPPEVTIEIFRGTSAEGTVFRGFTLPVSGGAFSGAPSEALPDGTYTAHARQSDSAAGSVTSSAVTFTVDTAAPTVALAEPAAGAVLGNPTPLVGGSAEPGAVTISISPGSPVFGALRALRTTAGDDGRFYVKVDPPLGDGVWIVQARQLDQAGNEGNSSAFSFQVDTRPPAVTITKGPVPVGGGTRDVQFEFGADEAATFKCTLDGTLLSACRSPLVLRNLRARAHALTITAIDAAGNEDPTPAVLPFVIDVAAPNLRVPQKISVSRRGRVSVGIKCPTAQNLGPCAGNVTLRRAGRSMLTAPMPLLIQLGSRGRIAGQLKPSALKQLRRAGRLRVDLILVAADGRGNVGRARLKRTLVYPK